MTVERHDFGGGDDYLAMQALTQRTWSSPSRWHVGDLAWARYSRPAADRDWPTALWMDGADCVAWGWVEPPGDLSLAVDPGRPGLAAAVLRWLDEVAADADQTCTVLETADGLVESLTEEGFVPDMAMPYFRCHSISLGILADPVLPAGFGLRHVAPGEAALRAAVHRAGWSEFGSRLSTQTYADVMAAPPYRYDLDWVVEAPTGELVASALGWLDDVNRVGLLEPVGCAPPYRRKGLARAVNLACLQAMREAGAETAHVDPRGDEAYPVPGRLYRSIGFEPGPRTVTYVKPQAA